MRIVVMGGGVIGAASAYWLMRDGHQVELVERREVRGGVGQGASPVRCMLAQVVRRGLPRR